MESAVPRPDGRERSRTFDRKADAERFLTGIEHSKLVGNYIDPRAGRITFGEYAQSGSLLAFIAHRRQRVSSPISACMRFPIWAVAHSPRFGTQRFKAGCGALSEALAPGTVENIYRTVSAVFGSAVRDRILAVNPCEAVVLPRRAQVEVVPPTVDEVHVILEAMPLRYRITGVLAAGTGLRQGEALGLTVDRVDFLRRQLRIDRQLVTPSRGDPHLAPPKSDASTRLVPLADVVLEALAEHLRSFPAGPSGLVVTYNDGRPIRRNRFGAMWRQSIARAGLSEGVRYHDLRHHFASALIAGGCSVKIVQKALGHASARETLDTYGHLWPDSEDLTRRSIDASFGSLAASPRPATNVQA